MLTTSNEAAYIDFYVNLLGMTLEEFGPGRKAFKSGAQKINLDIKGLEFEPKAHLPVPGALDICFLAFEPLDNVIQNYKRVATILSKDHPCEPARTSRFVPFI